MATSNITKRNIYTALIAMVDDGTISAPITVKEGTESTKIVVTPANIKAFAVAEIATLDKRNKARADKPTKAEIANATLIPEICKIFGGQSVISAEVAEKMGISPSKAASVLSRNSDYFIPLGKVGKGKSGKVNAYKVVSLDTPEDGEGESLDTPEK